MNDPASLAAPASAATPGLLIVADAALKGWSGWLEVRRQQIVTRRSSRSVAPASSADLADQSSAF